MARAWALIKQNKIYFRFFKHTALVKISTMNAKPFHMPTKKIVVGNNPNSEMNGHLIQRQ